MMGEPDWCQLLHHSLRKKFPAFYLDEVDYVLAKMLEQLSGRASHSL